MNKKLLYAKEIILEPIKTFGCMTVYKRKPRVLGYCDYVVGHKNGKLLEDFKKIKPALKWAKENK
jgi:hypothetical protein